MYADAYQTGLQTAFQTGLREITNTNHARTRGTSVPSIAIVATGAGIRGVRSEGRRRAATIVDRDRRRRRSGGGGGVVV
jgi:hypothetical protein